MKNSGVVSWFALAILMLMQPPVASAFETEIAKVSEGLEVALGHSGLSSIAVVDFTDLQGNVNQLGRFLAEELSISLAQSGGSFSVIDRTHLASILKEHKLSTTGLISPETARKLGEIAGVQALVTGTVTPFGDSIRVSAKILHVETAAVLGSQAGSLPKTDAIDQLVTQNILREAPGSHLATKRQAAKGQRLESEAENLKFQHIGCAASGDKVVCEALVVNRAEEKALNLFTVSRIIDEFGNEYPADKVWFGSQLAEGDSGRAQNILVNEIPTKLRLQVSKVPANVRSFALVEYVLSPTFWPNQERLSGQLRNVTLER
ncbi:MAG: FlgO family outer membrane protein [Acidobacteriota bacterium]